MPGRGQRRLQVGPPARRGHDAVDLGGDLLGQRRRPSVTSQASPSGPCSACTTRSTAANGGGALGPATTTISDGPAKADATPTTPDSWRLASATYALPGPAIDVDRRHAARAVGHGGDRLGPADPVHLVHPGDGGGAQRGRVDPCRRRPAGTHRAMLPTPATRAGAAHMRTVEG